jgi:hypothetical protein
MDDEEKKNVFIDGKQNYTMEEILGPIRDNLKGTPDDGQNKENNTDGSKIIIKKEFNSHPSPDLEAFLKSQAPPGLVSFIKFMAKISQPPEPRAAKTAYGAPLRPEPDERSETGPDLPGPEAINPSSSGWILWLAVIILAAFYLFYKNN